MNLRVFMRQLSRRIRERLAGMWNFSSLEKKLALAVSLIVVCIVGLFSLASFYLTKSHYEAMLYQSMSTSSSLVTYLLSSHLNDAVQLSDAIRSDAVIQHHLDLIYQDKDYRRSNSYDNIYTSQLNYYLQYKKPYLTYSAITNPRFVTYTYDYRYNRFSEEMLQEMQAEAARALGAPVWFSRYAEDGYLYLIQQIRKIEYLDLYDLGTVAIAIDMEELLTEITRESQGYPNIFWIFSQDGRTIYASSELQGTSLDQIPNLDGQYGLISLGDHQYFAMQGQLKDLDWNYYQLVPYDTTAAAQTTLLRTYVIVVFLGLAFTVFFIHLSIRRAVSGIQVLCRKMNAFRGDNAQAVHVPYDYSRRKDEIGQLHLYFDNMAREIETLINSDYKLKLDMKNMQLGALRAQINPHFLYNTLDSIYWRAKASGNEEICTMVESLGLLLRSSLSQKHSLVPFREELDLVNRYLSIQQIRYEDRLSCRFQLDDGLEDVLVPPLSIQPLVENSIKYGLEEFPDTCSIIISAAREPEDILVVEVRNNGSFFEEGLLEKLQQSKEQASGTGIGLLNIHQRIQLLWGAEYGLTLYNQDGFAVASIRIPITCQGGLAYAETDHRR